MNDLLQQFLKLLQQSSSKDTTYGSDGESSFSIKALIVDYQA